MTPTTRHCAPISVCSAASSATRSSDRAGTQCRPELHGIYDDIRDEFDLSVAEVLRVTGQAGLLDSNRTLQRTLAVRDVYVDPLSYLQVTLLARKRGAAAEEPMLASALLLTIARIAAGLKNTG